MATVLNKVFLTRFVSCFLLFLFLQILTPGIYIHAFFDHEDTHCHPGSECTIEPVHHHCAILKLTADKYLSYNNYPLPAVSFCYHTIPVFIDAGLPGERLFSNKGRAPPSS